FLNTGTSVSINTASGFGNAGTITQGASATILKTDGVNVALFLTASSSVVISQPIASIHNRLAVTINAGTTETIAASIITNGGNVSLFTGPGNDVTLAGTITTGTGGRIDINAGGSIFDDGNNATQLSADLVNLMAGNEIGQPGPLAQIDLATSTVTAT